MTTLLSPDLERQRQLGNPLRGLDAPRVARLLEQATSYGIFSELQWTLFHILKRWPVLRAARERRAAALLRLDWNVRPVATLPPGCTSAQAAAQVEALRAAYERVDNLREALRFLSLAEFTGFCHLQKHRDDAGRVRHLEPLDPWNWVRDGLRGPWYWNPAAQPCSASMLKDRPEARIDPAEFVIRETENPIYEAALPLYLYYTLALRDWAAYTEIYGLPKPVLILPEGPLTPAQEAEFQEAARNLADGGTGCLPHGTQVTFPAENRGVAPFKELIDDLEAKLVLATTSGKLAMLNDRTGLGSSTANTHQDAFNEIAEAEAVELGEVLQKQFDAEVLAREFPGQPALAYFTLSARQQANVTEITQHLQALAAAGYRVAPGQVTELTGYQLAAAPTNPNRAPALPRDGQVPIKQPSVLAV